MKHLFLVLAVVLSIFKSPAQPIQFFSGDIIENYSAETFRLFDIDSSALYALHKDGDTYFIDVFTKDSLRRTDHFKIPLPVNYMINYEVENLIIRKDTFHLFYSYFDNIELCEKLEMITFSKSGLADGPRKLIDKSEGKTIRKAGGFIVVNKKDTHEFLSYGSKQIKDTTYISIDHFDYAGNKTHSQNFLRSNPGFIMTSTVDENGNIIHLTKSKIANKDAKWSLQIYPQNSKSQKTIELYQPSLGRIYLSSSFDWYTNNQKCIVLVAPYLTSPSAAEAEGVYLAKINPGTGMLMAEYVIPFKKNGETGDAGTAFTLSSCMLRAIIPLSNEGLRLVFETGLQTITAFSAIPVLREYRIGSILSVDLNNQNQVTEIRKIKKQQEALKSGYPFSGFNIISHGDETYFIYNELPENLQRPPDKMKVVSSINRNKTVVIYSVVDSGKVVRKKLEDKISVPGTDAILPMSALTSTTGNEFFVLRKQNDKFVLTKFYTTN